MHHNLYTTLISPGKFLTDNYRQVKIIYLLILLYFNEKHKNILSLVTKLEFYSSSTIQLLFGGKKLTRPTTLTSAYRFNRASTIERCPCFTA